MIIDFKKFDSNLEETLESYSLYRMNESGKSYVYWLDETSLGAKIKEAALKFMFKPVNIFRLEQSVFNGAIYWRAPYLL